MQELSASDLGDIQGNLAGFNKDHVRLLFVGFPSLTAGRSFCAAMATEVNAADEVLAYNAAFKKRRQKGIDELSEPADWVNVSLSAEALTLVDAPDASLFPDEFRQGMRARAAGNGDIDTSAPATWIGPYAPGAAAVHALVVIAADLLELLEARTARVRALLSAAGVAEVAPPQDGNARPGANRGHEHFGFKDGISQPYVPKLTSSTHSGGHPIAAGEFLIGHLNQDGQISGSAVPQPPAASQPGYPPSAAPDAALPAWTKNGSFLVYRRLRQDVAGFHSFAAAAGPSAALTPEQLEARMVGRWPSGAPLAHVPGEPANADTITSDPASNTPGVLDDDHINHFGYLKHDSDGHVTPRACHIRKTYPRDAQPPGQEESDRHRLLRRGIAYGPEISTGEAAYPGTGPVPHMQDRGLLFLCYQASIARGFEFVQRSWANTADFPHPADGLDPIISQATPSPPFPLPGNVALTTQRWVTTTGGDYYFSPSLSGLKTLGALT